MACLALLLQDAILRAGPPSMFVFSLVGHIDRRPERGTRLCVLTGVPGILGLWVHTP